MYLNIKHIGKVFVPGKFEIYLQDKTPEYFTEKDLNFPTIFRCLKGQGIAVLEGDRDTVFSLCKAVDRQKKELVGAAVLRHKNIHYRNRCFRAVENSLMLRASGNKIRVTPGEEVPFLLNLCGETEDGEKERDYLIPVADYLKITRALEQKIPVAALGESLFSHYNVLPPQSRQTYDLIVKALHTVQPLFNTTPGILDMGCGCGVISFLAAAVFPGAEIFATDILVEALGTTKINAVYLQGQGKVRPGSVRVTGGGDLFEPLPVDQKFDIILFNAPWVYARVKSTVEQAINDEGFSAVKGFLAGCCNRLNDTGHVILCHSNHGGDKVQAILEKLFVDYGFRINHLFKDKIQSRMKDKKWVTIYVYDLVCREYQPGESL